MPRHLKDEEDMSSILHEKKVLLSPSLQPLLGKATVDVVGSGSCCSQPFLALELMGSSVLEGPQLDQDAEDAIFEALSQIHGAGILHGDVHPRNILRPKHAGQPRFADFGLSSFSRDRIAHAREMDTCKQELDRLRGKHQAASRLQQRLFRPFMGSRPPCPHSRFKI